MGLEVTKAYPELEIEKDDAVLVFREDGSFSIAIPKSMYDKPDEIAPEHVVLATAIASLIIGTDERLAELVAEAVKVMSSVQEFFKGIGTEDYLQ